MAKQWTLFWKDLGIRTVKKERFLKNYKVKNDYAALKRIGVSAEVAENIYQQTLAYNDLLFFHHLSLFFRQDSNIVMNWLGATSKNQAFTGLFGLIDPKEREKSQRKLSEISLVLKYHKKGEGWQFDADVADSSIPTFNPKTLVMTLNRMDKHAQYSYLGSVVIGNETLYGIEKVGASGPLVYKFIKLSNQANKLRVALSMDSTKEYYKAKKALEKAFNLYFDSPQSKRSLSRFEQFLVSGKSKHFVLSGVTYFDDTFKVSVTSPYNRPVNIAEAATYKQKISKTAKKTETVSVVRIFHNEKHLSKPISISILSYRTAGIIGAIQFVLNDRNLSETIRRKLKGDFTRNFGIYLNEYVSYNDLDELGIYKLLLESTPQKVNHVDLRSSLALSIYKDLLRENLLQGGSTSEEQARYCINRNCTDRNKIVWARKFCTNCGDPLIFGKRLFTQTIDEENVVNYIKSALPKGIVTKLANKLIKRNLFIAKIEDGENVAEFIPLSTRLQDHQLEVLKFRYPDLVIITSLDNLEYYNNLGFRAIRLYELAHNIRKGKSSLIWESLDEAGASHITHTRALCGESISRLTDNAFYKRKNELSKYLGAEFFEADCSTMLNYVFGNCLWLGAKYRGKSVPDGFTAFPLHDKRNGCFIWDTKYGEGKTIQMGNFNKNKLYIESAKTASCIRENGGLKGFVFISNKPFPKRFEKKYRRLVKHSRIKMTFLTASQLEKITRQYRRNEAQILNNEVARSMFLQSMREIFFVVKNSRNPQIIDDSLVDSLLATNSAAFKNMKPGKRLKHVK